MTLATVEETSRHWERNDLRPSGSSLDDGEFAAIYSRSPNGFGPSLEEDLVTGCQCEGGGAAN